MNPVFCIAVRQNLQSFAGRVLCPALVWDGICIVALANTILKYRGIGYLGSKIRKPWLHDLFIAAVFLLGISVSQITLASPGIVDFGELPSIRSMSISPDGEHIAFIRENRASKTLVIYELKNTQSAPIEYRLPDEIKARGLFFASNQYVLLLGSDTIRMRGDRRNKLEMTGSYVVSVKDKRVKLLLNKTRGLHPLQSGLGRVVALNSVTGHAYMPAFSAAVKPTYDLYRVSLETGLGKRQSRGRSGTRDWFVSANGKVLAREDFDDVAHEHQIYSYTDGKSKLIYKNKTDLPSISVRAISEDETQLLFVDQKRTDAGVFTLDLNTGEIGGPLFARSDSDVNILTDMNRKLVSVVYSKRAKYLFQNARLNELYRRVNASFPNSSIDYLSSTSDLSKVLFQVSGNYDPNSFVLFDTEAVTLNSLGNGYPNIKKEDLGEVVSVTYEARDGLDIPAIITWPANARSEQSRRNLPLIVLPHGGPELHDSVGFHWLAQYFAGQGYMVLQPNFRGSSGFGIAFKEAGRGEWGRKMQDDVTDGVDYLVSEGYVDSQRVCIVGGSYGGYSALAGGAFTPDRYRCVVSISGVSDLPKMLIDTKRRLGARHWVNNYWSKVIGDLKKEPEKLKEISPVYSAKQFMAPLLLIHGKDDTVVPLRQSRFMYKAMRKAGRDVELVVLDGSDHWLSTSKTRLRTLEEIGQFVLKHNPPEQVAIYQ